MAGGYQTVTASVSYDKTLKLFDFGSNRVIDSVTEISPLVALDWSLKNPDYIVFGTETGQWVVKDRRKLAVDLRRETVGKDIPVRKVGFSPHDGPEVLAVGADNLYFFQLGNKGSTPAVPFFVHKQAGYPVVDFCWNTARPYLIVSVGEHLGTDNVTGSGKVNVFEPHPLLLMTDEEAVKELERVLG